MATYQIWADITELAPDRFFVAVSAVPAHERTPQSTGGVATREASSMEAAKALRDEMVLELGKTLRARGHVIVKRFDEEKPGS
jgi:hypothetical protein